MLDTFGILVSTIMMMIVVVRAARLNGLLPWFESPPDTNAPLTGLEKARANAEKHIPAWRKVRK